MPRSMRPPGHRETVQVTRRGPDNVPEHSSRPAHLIACALWIGLAYGLVEGTGFMLLRLAPSTASTLNGTSPSILWVAPLEYASAFGLIGLLLAAANRLFPSLSWD